VLEAIQHGLPLVLSDIEANRDLGLDGHIYFPAQNPQALAESIASACRSPHRFTVPANRFQVWDEVFASILAEIGLHPDARGGERHEEGRPQSANA
jgi:glycosyltransferase involved in cell wall biosynthesis